MEPFSENTDLSTRLMTVLMFQAFSNALDSSRPIITEVLSGVQSLVDGFDSEKFFTNPQELKLGFNESASLVVFSHSFSEGLHAFKCLREFHEGLPSDVREGFDCADCRPSFEYKTDIPEQLLGRHFVASYKFTASGKLQKLSFMVLPSKASCVSILVADAAYCFEADGRNFDQHGKHETFSTVAEAVEAFKKTYALMKMLG